jgi:hypothetical protein
LPGRDSSQAGVKQIDAERAALVRYVQIDDVRLPPARHEPERGHCQIAMGIDRP